MSLDHFFYTCGAKISLFASPLILVFILFSVGCFHTEPNKSMKYTSWEKWNLKKVVK